MFTISSGVAMSTRPDVNSTRDNCDSPRVRNMTGVYLGTEVRGVHKSKPRHNIPPLARLRTSHQLRHQGELERHKVEVLRTREEQRGFNPLPIKRGRPRIGKPKEDLDPISPRGRPISPDYNQLTRKSSRSFTMVKNNGVSHVEYMEARDRLKSSKSDNGLPNPLDEIHRVVSSSRDLLGLDDVYNNVCKGNAAMLRSLLPQRRVNMGSRNQSIMAPLTVKSFRNPQNPHTVIQYSEIERPKSTKGQHRPPTVPAPYFYDGRKMIRAADVSSGRVKVVELPNTVHGNAKILAAPGVGAISRQASSKHIRKRPPSVIEGHPPPTTSSNSDSLPNLPMMDREPYKRVDSQETTRVDPPVPTATPTQERGGMVSPSPSVTEMLMKAQDSTMPGASSTYKDPLQEDHDKMSISGSIQVSLPSVDHMQPDSRASTPQLVEEEPLEETNNSSKQNENDNYNLEDATDKSENLKYEESTDKNENILKSEDRNEQVQETGENEGPIVEKTDSNDQEQGSNAKVDNSIAEDSGKGPSESSAVKSQETLSENENKNAETAAPSANLPQPIILIAVENDDGESQPVVIDDTPTETGQTDKGVSQNSHSSDEQLAEYIETANRKQTELQQLLEEHSQLVSQIDDMEKHHGETAENEESVTDDG
ncbi:uncharacterized protein LOC144453578 isoform X2 [Glandiceps talaboti]